jgi:branched-chain amino acid transport system substrate-binding protein
MKSASTRVALGLLAAGFAGLPAIAHAADTVKVGVVQSLSGPTAVSGNASLQGARLAVEAINEAGGIKALGGAKLELIPVDAPTPNTAGTVTQRLISQNKVSAVIGAYFSGTTLAVSEVTERAGVPLITFSFADQITGRGYKNVFQVSPKGSVLGAAQFNYAIDILKEAGKSAEKVAILYEDTAYGASLAQGFRNAAAARGVKIVLDEGYPIGITDATPLISKLRGADADLVFPVSSALNDSLQVVRSMRQQRVMTPVVGGSAGYVIPEFGEGLGANAEGILSIATANADQVPDVSSAYKKKYGKFMTHEAMINYASVGVLAKALETAASAKPSDVRDALAKTSLCDAYTKLVPSGCVKFDDSGLNASAHPIMVQWRGNELVTVYPASDAKTKVNLPN